MGNQETICGSLLTMLGFGHAQGARGESYGFVAFLMN